MSAEAGGLDSGDKLRAPIKRRHVIYVQGYDPRGLAEYYRMFRSEYRKFCSLHGLTGQIGKIVNPEDRFTTTWTLDTQGRLRSGEDWGVRTTYEFFRWEDIIRNDFARPVWWKILYALRAFGGTLFNGVYARIWRAHWRFAIFMMYPFVILATNLLLAALAGAAAKTLAALIVAPALAWIAGVLAFTAALVLIVRQTEPLSYMLYMFDDIASTDQFVHGRRLDWEARFEIFASYLREEVQRSEADEFMVVGHSSGSFIAAEVIARALANDPAFPRHKAVHFLSVGANFPIISFNPEAHAFRERMQRINASDVGWVDYQSRKDVMNFFELNPVTGQSTAETGSPPKPMVRNVRFADIVDPKRYPLWRWRFFEVHFQFLRANERRGAHYDYFMMCCGPFSLSQHADQPANIAAAVP